MFAHERLEGFVAWLLLVQQFLDPAQRSAQHLWIGPGAPQRQRGLELRSDGIRYRPTTATTASSATTKSAGRPAHELDIGPAWHVQVVAVVVLAVAGSPARRGGRPATEGAGIGIRNCVKMTR